MKMKKNDIIGVVGAGRKSILAKLVELEIELTKNKLKLKRGELKNLKENKITKRAIAQLKTALLSVKE
ncbi:MAG: hypothetical protein UY18_C0008G0016 [Microgenomates group bacterium GW2011_GWF2_47_9]|nr:MAG: hypothetical protein UY18_C0008G0016 [Microgenomates group bacterium GW2011_GWF2_47_9]